MYPAPLQQMMDALGRLPGIGPRSAERLAFYLVKQPEAFARQLAADVAEGRHAIQFCHQCHRLSDNVTCDVCRNTNRNPSELCVVAESADVFALERTQRFAGVYHVLGGLISPLDGVGPDQLHVQSLQERAAKLAAAQMETRPTAGGAEIILALPPTAEGDTTSLYLARQLKPLGIKVTRIAFGLPVGGHLDYADQLTLSRAMQGRQEVT